MHTPIILLYTTEVMDLANVGQAGQAGHQADCDADWDAPKGNGRAGMAHAMETAGVLPAEGVARVEPR